jgi:hypothetical protein
MGISRNFFSEYTGHMINNQSRDSGQRNRCADYELDAAECLEAYGLWRGERYCKFLIEDWMECYNPGKSVSSVVRRSISFLSSNECLGSQTRRHQYFWDERIKQVLSGQRKFLEFWGEKTDREAYGGAWEGFRPV